MDGEVDGAGFGPGMGLEVEVREVLEQQIKIGLSVIAWDNDSYAPTVRGRVAAANLVFFLGCRRF